VSVRFEFEILLLPEEIGGYRLAAYTEGVLRLMVGATAFLDADGVLLVEFGLALHKWLEIARSGPHDFYYASMDFEEEPILAFRYDALEDKYRLESVWAQGQAPLVPCPDVVAASRTYLADLRGLLKRKRGVDLEHVLRKSVSDG